MMMMMFVHLSAVLFNLFYEKISYSNPDCPGNIIRYIYALNIYIIAVRLLVKRALSIDALIMLGIYKDGRVPAALHCDGRTERSVHGWLRRSDRGEWGLC